VSAVALLLGNFYDDDILVSTGTFGRHLLLTVALLLGNFYDDIWSPSPPYSRSFAIDGLSLDWIVFL